MQPYLPAITKQSMDTVAADLPHAGGVDLVLTADSFHRILLNMVEDREVFAAVQVSPQIVRKRQMSEEKEPALGRLRV